MLHGQPACWCPSQAGVSVAVIVQVFVCMDVRTPHQQDMLWAGMNMAYLLAGEVLGRVCRSVEESWCYINKCFSLTENLPVSS